MERTRRWQDWINVVLAIWLFISPFLLSFTDNSLAAWDSYILGACVFIVAIWALMTPSAWNEWVNLAFGLWIFVSPLVLSYYSDLVPTWNQIVIGCLMILSSLWAVYEPVHRHPELH